MVRFFTGIVLVTSLFCPLEAKIFLLVDERLKKTSLEQTIYKFVPLTNATEVELRYVRDFLQGNAALEYLPTLKANDRALYIGSERWPYDLKDTQLLTKEHVVQFQGRISFLIDAKISPPAGLFDRKDLWRKFAEISATRYAGSFATYHLRASGEKIPGDWKSFHCVHESGIELKSSKKGPLGFSVTGGEFSLALRFREKGDLNFLGRITCINAPRADTIFDLQIRQTDIEISAEKARTSAWNDAQPLRLTIRSSNTISAPLALEIEPQINTSPTEFFFQGDRVTCEKMRCRKKNADFLVPAMRDNEQYIELAVRADREAYFRGRANLMAGNIQVASTEIRVTPHSWLAEFTYALRNPSEYKLVFLGFLLALLVCILCIAVIVRIYSRIKERLAVPAPLPTLQTSASALVESGKYTLTASNNPFDCVLFGFGGIIELNITPTQVLLHTAGKEIAGTAENFHCALPDGYRVSVRKTEGKFLLETFLVSV